MAPTPPGVELLDRSLAYTRLVLTGVTDADLPLPTPCSAWTLADLLAHLDDALDAFTEAADGTVSLVPATPALLRAAPVVAAAARVAGLQAKADTLLDEWRREPASLIGVGGARVPAATLARAAALEVAVHGNDVARTVRRPRVPGLRSLPEALAADLVDVADEVLAPADRAGRFARARPLPPDADASQRLLAHLGRDPAWTRG